jgi:hypothetical protein
MKDYGWVWPLIFLYLPSFSTVYVNFIQNSFSAAPQVSFLCRRVLWCTEYKVEANSNYPDWDFMWVTCTYQLLLHCIVSKTRGKTMKHEGCREVANILNYLQESLWFSGSFMHKWAISKEIDYRNPICTPARMAIYRTCQRPRGLCILLGQIKLQNSLNPCQINIYFVFVQ